MAQYQEFPSTVYLEFEKGAIQGWSAETISELFCDFGDFYVQKVSENSVFLEFFYVDPSHVSDKDLLKFIEVVKSKKEFKVVYGCLHQDAPRFVAHDKFDYE